MGQWYMLTLVGKDRPGIVARVSKALYEGGCNLGEASMFRLGGNFTIMLMATAPKAAGDVDALLKPVCAELDLRCHVDPIEGKLHNHVEPNVRVTLFGADRAGIVARATGALAAAGLNILHLESDVGGTEAEPIYIMQIEGVAHQGIEALRAALADMAREGVTIHVAPIDTLIG